MSTAMTKKSNTPDGQVLWCLNGEINMSKFLNRFLKNESGATAIEYGLIATFIAVAIIVGAQAVGVNLNTMFGDVATQIGS